MTYDTMNLIAKILLVLMYIATVTFLAYMAACYQSWFLCRRYYSRKSPSTENITPVTQLRSKKVDVKAEILQKNRKVNVYAH